jgi:hypothetical protein
MHMKMMATGKLLVLVLIATGSAQATSLLDITSSLTTSDPTQLGRLSRNGIPQDWAGTEVFPGVLNTTVTYHYHVYKVNSGNTPFIQILFDSASLNTFVSAYDTSYLPNSAGAPSFGFNVNWLGDAGFSGNPFPGDPVFFQVLIPANHDLLIVVNNTAAGDIGVGDPFHLIVEGFIDSEYTDPPSTVPEPSSVVLALSGLVFFFLKQVRLRWTRM